MPPQPATGYSLVFKGPFGQFTGAQFHFAPSPERIEHRRHALTTLVELPQAIYREGHGEGIQDVTLEGTFGVKARLANGDQFSGAQLHQYLEQLIENYWERLSKDPTLQVEYHDHGKDRHHYAEIMALDTPRSLDNKLHDRYMLELKLYAKIGKDKFAPSSLLVDKLQAARQAYSKFQKFLEFFKKISVFVRENPVSRFVGKAQRILNEYVLQPIEVLTTALGDFATGVTDIVAFPFRALNRINNGIADFFGAVGDITSEVITVAANVLRQTRRSLNRLYRFPDLFKAKVGAAVAGFDDAAEEFTAPFATDEFETQSQIQLAQTNRYTGARKAPVRKGDTLQKLALREMGSANLWQDIAQLNGMNGNTDLTGLRELLIPVVADTPASAIIGDVTDTQYATDERLYGRDLQVIQTSRGKLSVVFGANNDLATVGGKANLIQAVTLKTRIAVGTLLEDPAYGLRPLLGKPNSAEEEALALWGLRVAAESDPRIAEATVTQDTVNNRTAISYQLIPVGSTGARPINTVVEAVA